MISGLQRFARRPLALALAAAVLGLVGCGGRDAPTAAGGGTTAPAVTDAPAVPPTTAPPAATPGDGTDRPVSPAESDGGSAADAPSPAGVRRDEGSRRRERPRSLSERVAADETAKLNVRTMVSIIEGCHSGRDTYKDCNTHRELGGPNLIGLTIGKKRGDVQISATDNGFRITAHSMSGAKFTVARGPGGDRFKCISGRMPGACPPDRTWSW